MTAQTGKDVATQRKVSPALLVLLGLVALGAVVYLVMSLGGGGGSQQAAAPATSPSPGEAGTVAEAPGASPSAGSPTPGAQTFELSEARDPFRPLVVPPAEGAAAGASPAPTPVASAGPGAGGAPAPAGGEAVELLDVVVDDQGTAKAQVKVGSTVSTIAAGQTFASTYELLAIEGTCATMRNGDDNFTLCKGDQVLK